MSFKEMSTPMIIDLTPEKAKEYLAYNKLRTQRSLDLHWVRELVERQKRGAFRSGEIGLAYNGSTEPVLVNGQHQCNMVLSSGAPVKAKLELWRYETPQDLSNLFRQYDTHKARTQQQMICVESDSLQLQIPIRLSGLIVSAATLLESNRKYNNRVYTSQKVSLLGKYSKYMPFLSDIFLTDKQKMRGDTKHLQRAVIVSVMIKTIDISEIEAFVFWTNVRDGADLKARSPEKLLREFLKDNFTPGAGKRTGIRTATNKEFEYRTCGAWNAYRRKSEISYIKYHSDKQVPKLV